MRVGEKQFYYLTPFQFIFINKSSPTLFPNLILLATSPSVAWQTTLSCPEVSPALRKKYVPLVVEWLGYPNGVVVCIFHATGCGVAKMVIFEYKIGEKLLIKKMIIY